MASRYLLIEFDEEDAANSLRAKIDAATKAGKKFRVVGLFAKPGPTFCRCGSAWTSTKSEKARTKIGKRLGWVVCLECKKPIPAISFLKNLIKPSDIIDPSLTEVKGEPMGFYFYGISAPTLGAGQFKGNDG